MALNHTNKLAYPLKELTVNVLKIFSCIGIALGWTIIFLRVSKSRVGAYIAYEIHQGCLTRARHTLREFIWEINIQP